MRGRARLLHPLIVRCTHAQVRPGDERGGQVLCVPRPQAGYGAVGPERRGAARGERGEPARARDQLGVRESLLLRINCILICKVASVTI